ncbi:MAG: hypothetical protein M1816_005623 [Peltula sp. TS41687]|nr:MAG: hypothetical protein M1816_005623 [Peltula sp. TS41687]
MTSASTKGRHLDLHGPEALATWRHPIGTSISPCRYRERGSAFISVVLDCELQENLKRVQAEGKAGPYRAKLTDPLYCVTLERTRMPFISAGTASWCWMLRICLLSRLRRLSSNMLSCCSSSSSNNNNSSSSSSSSEESECGSLDHASPAHLRRLYITSATSVQYAL